MRSFIPIFIQEHMLLIDSVFLFFLITFSFKAKRSHSNSPDLRLKLLCVCLNSAPYLQIHCHLDRLLKLLFQPFSSRSNGICDLVKCLFMNFSSASGFCVQHIFYSFKLEIMKLFCSFKSLPSCCKEHCNILHAMHKHTRLCYFGCCRLSEHLPCPPSICSLFNFFVRPLSASLITSPLSHYNQST